MRTTKTVSILALTLALAGGMAATPAFADLPSKPGNIKEIDANKNGKVEKDEYLAFMSKLFDKSAGAKGYCTFQEIEQGFKSMQDWTMHNG